MLRVRTAANASFGSEAAAASGQIRSINLPSAKGPRYDPSGVSKVIHGDIITAGITNIKESEITFLVKDKDYTNQF